MTSCVVKASRRGRGVFATRTIQEGEIFEVSPVLLLPGTARALERVNLHNHVYGWTKKYSALACGVGSFFNHSYRPDATYNFQTKARTISFTALREILVGEEIKINYNGKAADRTPLWFHKKRRKRNKPPSTSNEPCR